MLRKVKATTKIATIGTCGRFQLSSGSWSLVSLDNIIGWQDPHVIQGSVSQSFGLDLQRGSRQVSRGLVKCLCWIKRVFSWNRKVSKMYTSRVCYGLWNLHKKNVFRITSSRLSHFSQGIPTVITVLVFKVKITAYTFPESTVILSSNCSQPGMLCTIEGGGWVSYGKGFYFFFCASVRD